MTLRESILRLGLNKTDKVFVKTGTMLYVREILSHPEWMDKDVISVWSDGENTVIDVEDVL